MTFRLNSLPVFALCIGVIAGGQAQAASFNCAHAVLAAEEAICADAQLGRLDEQTAGMYFLIAGAGPPAATMQQVKASQRKFIEARNACGSDRNCLIDSYTAQIMLLKNIKGNLGL
jgi:uncharacterized protein